MKPILLRRAFLLSLLATCLLASQSRLTAEVALPRTLLFVDDEDVLYRSGTEKKLEPLHKYEGNPVLYPEYEWEMMIGWVSVYHDPQTGKFQMWYQAYNDKRVENKQLKCVVAYAESQDGKHWVKPKLGLFPYYETKETNIVLIGAPNAYGDRYCNSVVVTPWDPDPARKYKMVYYDWEPNDERNLGAGTHVAFSPDGIHWTKVERIINHMSFGAKGKQVPFEGEGDYVEGAAKKDGNISKNWLVPLSMSDAEDVIYDPMKGVYAVYGKMWMQGPDGGTHWKHGMGRMESKDFLTWSKPQFVLGPNDNDPPQIEFHTSPVFIYNGQYFSLNQMLTRSAGTMDIELISSRDGLKWGRPFQGLHFLERGTGAVFDAATLLTNSTPIPMGDEVYFYYGGYRGTAIGGVGLGEQKIGSSDYHSGIGLATMQKDRFVAIVPDPRISLRNSLKVSRDSVGKQAPTLAKPNTIGQVTLRPLDLSKVKELTLNADATGGKISVELLDEDGYRLHGFSRDEAVPLTGNGLAQKVAWKEKTLSDLKPGKYMIRVHLDNAKLYACTLL